jgi:hypothetical protein
MWSAVNGRAGLVQWLVDRGAAQDHTAKFGLSALMLAVVNGHTDVVRILLRAGADAGLRGTGAPGFAGRTALDLADARGDREMASLLGGAASPPRQAHVASATTWDEVRSLLDFIPREPSATGGHGLRSLAVHVRDHRLRDLAVGERTLEAHYGAFVFSQARRGAAESRRLALEVSYGPAAMEARIAGREARAYDHGPEVPHDDPDGRLPAVVVWCDGEMFYLLASGELPVDALLRIGGSLYA